METERHTLLTAKEAAQYLRVSLLTLSKIADGFGISLSELFRSL